MTRYRTKLQREKHHYTSTEGAMIDALCHAVVVDDVDFSWTTHGESRRVRFENGRSIPRNPT